MPKIIASTANCGLGGPGIRAFLALIKQMNDEDAGVAVINCQELNLSTAIEEFEIIESELKRLFDKIKAKMCSASGLDPDDPDNKEYERMLTELGLNLSDYPTSADTFSFNFSLQTSQLMETYTKPYQLDCFLGQTGMASLAIVNTKKATVTFSEETKVRRVSDAPWYSGASYNKGGLVSHLTVTDVAEEGQDQPEAFTVQTVTAHLDSERDQLRKLDWFRIQSSLYPHFGTYEELGANIPYVQLTGMDCNTRNAFNEDDPDTAIFVWQREQGQEATNAHEEVRNIRMRQAGKMYSLPSTYKTAQEKAQCTKRPDHWNYGSLDMVGVSRNDQYVVLADTMSEDNYYIDAGERQIGIEVGEARDHVVISSPAMELTAESSEARLKHFLSNQLQHVAPQLALEIHDREVDHNTLLKLYNDFLPAGGLLNQLIHPSVSTDLQTEALRQLATFTLDQHSDDTSLTENVFKDISKINASSMIATYESKVKSQWFKDTGLQKLQRIREVWESEACSNKAEALNGLKDEPLFRKATYEESKALKLIDDLIAIVPPTMNYNV